VNTIYMHLVYRGGHSSILLGGSSTFCPKPQKY